MIKIDDLHTKRRLDVRESSLIRCRRKEEELRNAKTESAEKVELSLAPHWHIQENRGQTYEGMSETLAHNGVCCDRQQARPVGEAVFTQVRLIGFAFQFGEHGYG